MKRLQIVNIVVLITLLTSGLALLPPPIQAAPTDYDCTTATGLPQTESATSPTWSTFTCLTTLSVEKFRKH